MSTKRPDTEQQNPTDTNASIEPTVVDVLDHREALRTAAEFSQSELADDYLKLARAFDAAVSLAKLDDDVNPEIRLDDDELVLLAFAHHATAQQLRRDGHDAVAGEFKHLATAATDLFVDRVKS
jgi:hypothetical protein